MDIETVRGLVTVGVAKQWQDDSEQTILFCNLSGMSVNDQHFDALQDAFEDQCELVLQKELAREELIKLGRQWLEHSPPAGKANPELIGWSGELDFVCADCASRIFGRGCDMNRLADHPVWKSYYMRAIPKCDLCEVEQ